MELKLEMRYDLRSMTAMAKVLRQGLQEKENKKSLMVGWVFVVLAVAILLTAESFGYRQIIASVAIVLFALYLLLQDRVNGWLALNRLPRDMRTGEWLFREDGYYSNTAAGEADFSYENIFVMAEAEGYIFLVFQDKKAQILDLSTIRGGDAADLRRLLRKKTSLTLQQF